MDTQEVGPTVDEVVNLLKTRRDELQFQLELADIINQKLRARIAELEAELAGDEEA